MKRRSVTKTQNKQNERIIEVMSDVEGCWNKIITFMKKSDIFRIGGKKIDDNFKPEQYNQVTMSPFGFFVCLGDTIDNGPNNIAILRLLRFLKINYFNRVIFILGNRDINKIRLRYELDKKRVNIDRLTKNELPYGLGKSRPEILKWILTNTMGCPNTFEFIKNEVGINDDEKVVDKYIDILKVPMNYDTDTGLLYFYLKFGNLVYYKKNVKALFMHGGLNCKNFLYVSGKKYSSIQEWVKSLNEWYQSKINQVFYNNADETEIEDLLLYQDEREYIKKDGIGAIYSVVISRPWKTPPIKSGSIGSSIIDEGCFDKISADVNFVFVGHTPVGQLPVIYKLTKNNKKITFVFGDTTYSGRIANIKLIEGNVYIKADYLKDQKLEPKGICSSIKDTTEIRYSSEDKYIGTEKDDGIVIAKIGGEYLIGKWNLNKENPTMLTVI